MPAIKEELSQGLTPEANFALKYREIKERVKHDLSGASDSDLNNASIEDIIEAAVHVANEEKPEELEEIVKSSKPEKKQESDGRYTGIVKKVGHAGLKLLEYAMIPVKRLYKWIISYFKDSYHRKSVKKALRNPKTTMSELNEKSNYPMKKVRDRVYTAIAYVAAKIVEAARVRFANEENEKKESELKQRMETYWEKTDWQAYSPVFAEPSPKPKASKPYVSPSLEDQNPALRNTVLTAAVTAYIDADNYEQAEAGYFGRQAGNLWARRNIVLDRRFPGVHRRLIEMPWRAAAMRRDDLGHGYMLNKN